MGRGSTGGDTNQVWKYQCSKNLFEFVGHFRRDIIQPIIEPFNISEETASGTKEMLPQNVSVPTDGGTVSPEAGQRGSQLLLHGVRIQTPHRVFERFAVLVPRIRFNRDADAVHANIS